MRSFRSMSAFARVLWGLGLGILTGLFFGESAGVLDIVGNGYVRLLQMTVLPYVLVSLVAGIGRLDIAVARQAGLRGAALILLLWFVTLTSVLFLVLVYPDWTNSTYFSASLLTQPEPFDPLTLYLPANPFFSLANGVVPAVVVFSILLGTALIAVPNKERLLDGLQVLGDGLMRVASTVGKLAPFGIFAIAATAAGTLRVEELSRLQVYLWGYLAVWVVLAYWTLPTIVAAATPFSYRQVVRAAQVPMITALATGTVLVVIPMIVERCRELVAERELESDDADSMIDLMAPTAYSFPSTGTLLGLGFVQFAGWYAGAPLAFGDYPSFVGVGAFVAFGSMAVAIPFMLDFFALPTDFFQLYLLGSVVTGRLATALAAMHGIAVCLLGAVAIAGHLQLRRLGRAVLLSLGASAASCLVVGLLLTALVPYEYSGEDDFVARDTAVSRAQAVINPEPAALSPFDRQRSRLDVIRERGTLRVGYEPDALPFAHRNASGDTVGLDLDLMHTLALDMGVDFEIVRTAPDLRAEWLESGRLDILVGGLPITPELAVEMTLSAPYMEHAVALVVPDYRRHEFTSFAELEARDDVRIAIPDLPYYVAMAERLLPDVQLERVMSPREYFVADTADALLYSAEGGSAWALIYPEYGVVVPSDVSIRAPIAFGLPHGQPELVRYIDTWIGLVRTTGTLETLNRYWILGQNVTPVEPRWSVLRNVLGWGDP